MLEKLKNKWGRKEQNMFSAEQQVHGDVLIYSLMLMFNYVQVNTNIFIKNWTYIVMDTSYGPADLMWQSLR